MSVYDAERYTGTSKALGTTLFEKIRAARVLVIGAGGIGCELLKNIVLVGFQDIEVVDLDTIDYSNLNRQFLFHKQHVGLSKSRVARESVLEYNPQAKIKSHHGNVMSAEFGPEFVGKFDIVLNALDNLAARRHVNRVVLAANVPLVESGTAGYLGQVQVIKKGATECFECHPKPAPTVYPVCTIRSNPTKMIHCVVWAKMLFKLLFGPVDPGNPLGDGDAGDDTSADAGTTVDDSLTDAEKLEQQAVKEALAKDELVLKELKKGDATAWMFHKVFHTDILTLSSLKTLWKGKKMPRPLTMASAQQVESEPTPSATTTDSSVSLLPDQQIWTLQECIRVLLDSVKVLKPMKEDGPLEWDKDIEPHLNFVTAAANLRAYIFNLDMASRFDVKSQAGNIIPAIATTNAVIAGLIVMEAIKVIGNRFEQTHSTYLYKNPNPRGTLLLKCPNGPQRSNCYVCGRGIIVLKINTNTTKFADLLKEVIRGDLNMIDPTVMVGDSIIYESGDDADDFDFQLPKTLVELGIKHQSFVSIEDFTQDLAVTVSIVHVPGFQDEDVLFKLVGEAPAAPAASNDAATGDSSNANERNNLVLDEKAVVETKTKFEDDDDIMIVSASHRVVEGAPNMKRTANEMEAGEGEAGGQPPNKKRKTVIELL